MENGIDWKGFGWERKMGKRRGRDGSAQSRGKKKRKEWGFKGNGKRKQRIVS